LAHREIVALMTGKGDDQRSKAVTLPDHREYEAVVSTVRVDGKTVGRVCVLHDITYFRRLDALKTDFVNTVSHDLRSPLTLMHGYATMLQMTGGLNEQQAQYAHKIAVGVDNMSRLVNNLLDLGRIEAGVDLQVEMVPLVDLVEHVVDNSRHQAAQKRIEVIVALPQDTRPLVEADQAWLEQAFQNLVENAIKYTHPGGKVRVSLEVDQGRQTTLFKIQDTGIGIAPIDQPKLFERFFRVASRESRRQKGTGLGLSIVKSIADRHHGRVWVESQLGQGSTFYFELPLRQPGSPL